MQIPDRTLDKYDFAIRTMHFRTVNKIPTNASKIPMYWHIISLLHVSAHQRRHLQGVQYEPAELLPNVMKAEWGEGCILWPSLWDVTSHTLFLDLGSRRG
jgi:hypothetical protein